MNSERWRSCTEIFHRTVGYLPEERVAILEQTCQGDRALRRRVETLLQYHDEAGDFITVPAFAVAPELLVEDPGALVGRRLGCYRLDAIAGVGGMSVVYRACDERLGRTVALKLLPLSLAPDEVELERLQREARTASALNHPNIVTIHDIGQFDGTPYIATEFVEGLTLRARMKRGPIPPREALAIAIQVASALEVSHRAGVVHRDIKPENIILRPDGYLKVLDFGIANVGWPEAAESNPSRAAAGVILGTARYMSPEQARGEEVDGRSDLWSLGVVLYEMLARRAPFEAATPRNVITAILQTDPPSLKGRVPMVPLPLQRTVERCLQKDATARHQTAAELLSVLRTLDKGMADSRPSRAVRRLGLAAAAALLVGLTLFYGRFTRPSATPEHASRVSEKSIAVLPFENLSTDPANAFLADGLHDDVVTSLAKIKDLKVIARGSVMDYRGASTAGKLREIGRALGVRHLLLGSVRRSENHVAVNVAMIDLSNQEQQWAQHYERTFSDALRLQNELALDIARELRATLTPAEVSLTAAKPTENASAYLCYLRGRERERIVQATPELTREAIHFYEQAVHLDPGFALARARLSLCASMLLNWEADGDFRTKARTEADEALRLDPNLGEAHLASAHCYLWGDQDYDRALDALGRAADHLPNSAEIPLTAAFIYKRQNRFRDRIAALQRAEALDPMNRTVLIYLTNTLRWVRQWHEAIKSCDRQHALAGDEEMFAWRWRRAQDEFQQTGDVGALKKAIADEMASDPQAQPAWLELARYTTAMFERDYPEAARALSQVSPQSFRQIPRALAAHTKAFDEAILAVAAGADTKQDALKIADRELQTLLAPDASPGFATNRPEVDLAVIEAFLGRKEDAIRRALEAVAQVPNPPGTIERNLVSAGLALVYAQTDEPDKAISLIEHLLTVPCELQTGTIYNMTLTDLKWRWQWDPLRSHPRFQKLLAGSEPVTVY